MRHRFPVGLLTRSTVVWFLLAVVVATGLARAQSAERRERVALGAFEVSAEADSGGLLFASLLEARLVRAQRFELVTRADLDLVLDELALREAGLARGEVSFGTIEGVDYLITGGVFALPAGGYLISARAIEVTTARVAFAATGVVDSLSSLPALADGFVADLLSSFPVRGQVVSVHGRVVTIDVGSADGVGARYSAGQVTRPEPGSSVGESLVIATISDLDDVREDSSTLRFATLGGASPPEPGDEVVLFAVPETGELVLEELPPAAGVEINGRAIADATRPISLPAGVHLVRLAAPGFVADELVVDVIAGRRVVLSPALTRAVGTLVVSVEPPGAFLFLNGREIGSRVIEVPAGEHVVTASAAGYESVSVGALVHPGGVTPLELELLELPAFLRVDAKPSRAEIAVNGATVRTGEWTEVSAGEIVIVVQASQHETVMREFVVAGGDRREVTIELAPLRGAVQLPPLPDDAVVVIDGAFQTRDVHGPISLAAGSRNIRVEANGFVPYVEQIEVAADETTVLAFRLYPTFSDRVVFDASGAVDSLATSSEYVVVGGVRSGLSFVDIPILASPTVMASGEVNTIYAVALGPTGLLATGSGDRTVRLWRLPLGQLETTLRGHDGGVRDVSFSPDGSTIASASDDRTVRVWDVASGSLLHTFRQHEGGVFAVAYIGSGDRLVAGDRVGAVVVHNLRHRTTRRIEGVHGDAVLAIAVSGDGQLVATGSADGGVMVWTTSASGDLVRSRELRGHGGAVKSVAFDDVGSLLAVAGESGSIIVYKTSDWSRLTRLDGHSGAVHAVGFFPDSGVLFSGGADTTVRSWVVR